MKLIKFLSVLTILSFFLASCNKESLTTVEDNIPEVEVIEETETNTGIMPSYSALVSNGQTALATFVFDSTTMEVNNYSLAIPSSMIGVPDVIFSSAWTPVNTETTLQEGTYVVEHLATLSQDGIDVMEDWIANGADPNNIPNILDYEVNYTGPLTYAISNITATTADVEIAGSMTDPDGNVFSISESITADLY